MGVGVEGQETSSSQLSVNTYSKATSVFTLGSIAALPGFIKEVADKTNSTVYVFKGL